MNEFRHGLTNPQPVEPARKVSVTFLDGAKREFPKDTTSFDTAKGTSPSRARRAEAMARDGDLADFNDSIEQDARDERLQVQPDEPEARRAHA